MAGVNRVILVGHLGKDPEVRFSQGGTCFCHLSLAVNERRKEGDGWKDIVEWVRVVVVGAAGQAAGEHLRKGRQVYVEGSMRTRSFKDKEGVEKWQTEVVAFQCQFLGPAPGDGNGAARSSSGGKHREERAARGNELTGGKGGPPNRGDDGAGYGSTYGAGASDGFIDDDLPF